MYRKCVTEEAANRQAAVEECLLRLMDTTAYSRINVSTICQQAGISRTAFYRYYENKDACLQSLLDRTLFAAGAFPPPFDPDPDRASMRQILQFWKSRRKLLDALLENSLMDRLVLQIVRYVQREEPAVLELLCQGSDAPCGEESLVFLFSGLLALIVYWHQTDYPGTEEEMADRMLRLLTLPLVRVE